MSMSSRTKNPEVTAVATVAGYAAAQTDPTELRTLLEANVGEAGVSEFDIDRIRVPAGGGCLWQVPGLEGPQSERAIEGVIVGWRDPRAYWAAGLEATGGGTPPDCSSPDGVLGSGKPGGDCAACPLARFGSAVRDGKPARAQACKQTRILFLVREGDLLPVAVVAPPSSLHALRQYFLRLTSRGTPYYGAVTALELIEERNKDGVRYSRVAPRVAGVLAAADRERMLAYARAIAPLLSRAAVEPADVGPAEE